MIKYLQEEEMYTRLKDICSFIPFKTSKYTQKDQWKIIGGDQKHSYNIYIGL